MPRAVDRRGRQTCQSVRIHTSLILNAFLIPNLAPGSVSSPSASFHQLYKTLNIIKGLSARKKTSFYTLQINITSFVPHPSPSPLAMEGPLPTSLPPPPCTLKYLINGNSAVARIIPILSSIESQNPGLTFRNVDEIENRPEGGEAVAAADDVQFLWDNTPTPAIKKRYLSSVGSLRFFSHLPNHVILDSKWR